MDIHKYSYNGDICIAVLQDPRDGTLTVVKKRLNWRATKASYYTVWVGCADSGETPYGHLTRRYGTKAEAMKAAKKHGDGLCTSQSG